MLLVNKYQLKVHCKSHEGEKCYKCELCPYASMSQRHLETHMLIHTDEKPFHCKLCDQVIYFYYYYFHYYIILF